MSPFFLPLKQTHATTTYQLLPRTNIHARVALDRVRPPVLGGSCLPGTEELTRFFYADRTSRGETLLRDALLKFQDLFQSLAGSLYHIAVVALSATIALSLPAGARHFLAF